MEERNYELLISAKEGKMLYLSGKINKKIALEYMNPYIFRYNQIAKEKGEKYNIKVSLINFNKLINSRYF